LRPDYDGQIAEAGSKDIGVITTAEVVVVQNQQAWSCAVSLTVSELSIGVRNDVSHAIDGPNGMCLRATNSSQDWLAVRRVDVQERASRAVFGQYAMCR
jgi:hypothetical protein